MISLETNLVSKEIIVKRVPPISELRAPARDDFAIPVEAVLADAAQVLRILFVAIDIHEAVALLVAVEPTQDVGEGPGAVAQQLHAVADRLAAGDEVVAQVGDAVVVVDAVVGGELVE